MDLKPTICGENELSLPESGCNDCDALEERVKKLEECCEEVQDILPNKLEASNFIEGDHITINVDGNDITISVADLINYYTKGEVNALLEEMSSIRFEVVDELPAFGENGVIYLVPTAPGSDEMSEYIWIENAWELIGHTSVDMSNYYTKTEVDELIEDFITCEGLTDCIESRREDVITALGYEEVYLAIKGKDGSIEEKIILARDVPPTRTVLYSDGHFIINESPFDRATNERIHGGGAVGEWDAFDPDTNPYIFSADGDQPWFSKVDDIKSAAIGSVIQPTSTFRWFSSMHNVEVIDLTNLDTINTTTFERMFTQCNKLESVNVEVLNTTNVTSMMMMFYRCDALREVNVSTWNISRVTTMNQMFRLCGELVTIYASNSFDTSLVSNANNMFTDCIKLVGGNGTAYDSTKVKLEYAKCDCGCQQGYFTCSDEDCGDICGDGRWVTLVEGGSFSDNDIGSSSPVFTAGIDATKILTNCWETGVKSIKLTLNDVVYKTSGTPVYQAGQLIFNDSCAYVYLDRGYVSAYIMPDEPPEDMSSGWLVSVDLRANIENGMTTSQGTINAYDEFTYEDSISASSWKVEVLLGF